MTWIPPEGQRVRSPRDPENACLIRNRITAAAAAEAEGFELKGTLALVLFPWNDETASWGAPMTIMDLAKVLEVSETTIRNRIIAQGAEAWEGQIEIKCRRWRWVNYRKKRRFGNERA